MSNLRLKIITNSAETYCQSNTVVSLFNYFQKYKNLDSKRFKMSLKCAILRIQLVTRTQIFMTAYFY